MTPSTCASISNGTSSKNDGDYRAALKKIGLKTKTASVMNWKCKCYHFPSIEGLKHMLAKEKYLDGADSDDKMED